MTDESLPSPSLLPLPPLSAPVVPSPSVEPLFSAPPSPAVGLEPAPPSPPACLPLHAESSNARHPILAHTPAGLDVTGLPFAIGTVSHESCNFC